MFSKKEKQAYVTGKIVGAKMAKKTTKTSYRKPTAKTSVKHKKNVKAKVNELSRDLLLKEYYNLRNKAQGVDYTSADHYRYESIINEMDDRGLTKR